MKLHLFTFAIFISFPAVSQTYNLHGTVHEPEGKPAPYVALSLLNPNDSTLVFFGISNEQGEYIIKSATAGNYILQAAGMGYVTQYKTIAVPVANNELGDMKLNDANMQLKGVEIKSEKIPIMLKKDTVEYNASSYKTKPDAAVEDLLKKLPGVEVDKSGNIKAQGKNVQKVLVDGKEFFGDDPKIATKNLPADAIDKIQVFDGKSYQAQFSGIDDGERDKTINLMLKSGKKHGYFGDIEAGGGTGEHYKASAKLYRFQQKSQFAALGMLNNINQFGFTLQDYIAFKGGIRGLLDGNGINLQFNKNTPVNFGQLQTGLISSGAAGLNYTWESRKNNRFNISYLGNGVKKNLEEKNTTENFTDNNNSFSNTSQNNDLSKNWGHRIYYNWRNDIDSSQQLLLNGGVEADDNRTNKNFISSATIQNLVLNQLNSNVTDNDNEYSGNMHIGYLKKNKSYWSVWKINADGNLQNTDGATQWQNQTLFPQLNSTINDEQYQNNNELQYNLQLGSSIVRKLGNSFYLEPEIKSGYDVDKLKRKQGQLYSENAIIDSLSPVFERAFQWLRAGVSFKKNSEKQQFNLSIRGEELWLQSILKNGGNYNNHYTYTLPSAFWQYEYAQNSRIQFYYNTNIQTPSAQYMLPTTDYTNPQQQITGNPLLKPEYQHALNASWFKFNTFNFTSLVIGLRGNYTHNKINYARTVNPDLSQMISYINVPADYTAMEDVEYTAPVRALRVNITMMLSEQYKQGKSLVNNAMNTNNIFTHGAKIKISNRRKDKLDAEFSLSTELTNSKFSIEQSLNNQYLHYNAFAEIGYHPVDFLYFNISSDIDHYDAQSFNNSFTIPLLKASASYYFLKGKRAVLTAEGFDLLNKNQSIRRISQLNYISETNSNIIGRYFLLSFKYKLSKAGNGQPKMDIQIK